MTGFNFDYEGFLVSAIRDKGYKVSVNEVNSPAGQFKPKGMASYDDIPYARINGQLQDVRKFVRNELVSHSDDIEAVIDAVNYKEGLSIWRHIEVHSPDSDFWIAQMIINFESNDEDDIWAIDFDYDYWQ
jgi:hypothetical protein